mmetsp:Transcript_109542/g.349474  ORF Transcript_109542/g.349474 Transcript_109542/m.349474 type:complete len:225 (-) Transcript_109542:310-984(-)
MKGLSPAGSHVHEQVQTVETSSDPDAIHILLILLNVLGCTLLHGIRDLDLPCLVRSGFGAPHGSEAASERDESERQGEAHEQTEGQILLVRLLGIVLRAHPHGVRAVLLAVHVRDDQLLQGGGALGESHPLRGHLQLKAADFGLLIHDGVDKAKDVDPRLGLQRDFRHDLHPLQRHQLECLHEGQGDVDHGLKGAIALDGDCGLGDGALAHLLEAGVLFDEDGP